MPGQSDLRGLSFLAIDDDAVFLETLAAMLTAAGAAKVYRAPEAETARRFLTKKPPAATVDCILCDYSMAPVNG